MRRQSASTGTISSYDNIRARPESCTNKIVELCITKGGWGTLMGSSRDKQDCQRDNRKQLENQLLQYNETWTHTTPVSSFCSPVHLLTKHKGAHACDSDWSNGRNVHMSMRVLSKTVVLEE